MQIVVRCPWCEKDDLYKNYHDTEWGIPSYNDHHLFEHLILETFQAGLSWHTILVKRENFRKAFNNFDALAISKFGAKKISELMQDTSIIRSMGKINAAINNAKLYLECVVEFGSFSNYIWQFTGHKVLNNSRNNLKDLPATSAQSDAMSKDMKRRGFKYIGSITCYAYMQSVGMVNDHLNSCFKKQV